MTASPVSRLIPLASFVVATAGEFAGLFFWLRFYRESHYLLAALVLLLGFTVERAVVAGWLHLPANVPLANGNSYPLGMILVGVTVAEIIAWILCVESLMTAPWWAAGLLFFVLIHLIHSYEASVVGRETWQCAALSPGPLALSVIETVGAILWIRYVVEGRGAVGATILLASLLLEHTLQGFALSARSRESTEKD